MLMQQFRRIQARLWQLPSLGMLQLKSRKLEELAEQIKSDRAKHDAKGKQVESSREGENLNANQDQNQNGDTNNSGGTIGSINQEKVDEMLAASLAAEEETGFTGEENHCTSVPLQGAEIDEDEDDDEGMIFPMTTGDIDPAVLASLPPSMQLDLLVQMRERVMAENRQKYQKIKKEPAKFSELQIQSYLKTVVFRRKIDQVQKCAAGKGVGGVQTSKIASEANREFIFSTSFTGDKQMLAQRGEKEQIVDSSHSKREINSAVFRSNPTSSSGTTKPSTSKHLKDFGPDVETYRDERGRIRVSRVRAMGIRMTRDIQRNLDFIKENEQVSRVQTNVHKISTVSEEPPDFPEHLFESNELQSSLSLDEEFLETAEDNQQISSLVRGSDNTSESTCYGKKETIEISFMDDQTEPKDNYDDIFLHLASGTASDIFADNDCLDKKMEESEGFECIWEEGVNEGETLPMKLDEKDNKSCMPENCSDDEVEWEEGDSLVLGVASSSECNTCNVPKGDMEEEALVQEAIRRSLEDFDKQASENVSTEDMQASVGNRSLQFSDGVSKISETHGETTSHSGAALVKETNEESRIEINPDDNDVIHSTGLIGTNRQENENQPQRVNNDGHVDVHRDHLLESLPHCTASTSNIAEKTSDSSKVNCNNVMISRTEIPETLVDGRDKNIEQNSMNSNQSKCSQDVANIGETLKSPRKDLLVDEPVACTTEPKEHATEGDLKVSTSEMNYTQVGGNDDSHGISANYLDEELSRLRQEQIDLGHERRKLESHAESVSSEMFAECQELLQMFGLPYIIAPMEAEAQCAYMEMSNLVDGVVTDDSDVFLFGARNVYKNIFDDRKYVETYFMKDIESELGLTRQQLIRMALLLGSDYTEGVSGIGIVNAIEVVHAFPEEDGLQKFKEWIESPDPSIFGQLHMERSSKSKKRKAGGNDSDGKGKGLEPECNQGSDDRSSSETERIKEIFMSNHRNVSKNWHIPAAFPSESVINAYITPQVDNSTEPFSWGRPDLGLLRKLSYAWRHSIHSTRDLQRFAAKGLRKLSRALQEKVFLTQMNLSRIVLVLSRLLRRKMQAPLAIVEVEEKRTAVLKSGIWRVQKIRKLLILIVLLIWMSLLKKITPQIKETRGGPLVAPKEKGEAGRMLDMMQKEVRWILTQNILQLQMRILIRHIQAITNLKELDHEGMRKQVTYMEDGDEADGSDVPVHQNDENDPGETAENTGGAGFNLAYQDTSELNSIQMHTDIGAAEDINEDSQRFELNEGRQDLAPKDYLFSGGGFCMEDGDELEPAGDRCGAEMEKLGKSNPSDDMMEVSDSGKSASLSTAECTENAGMEARGASSQQRRKASRGLSAMPTLTKRRRKS
ncbi:DNA repair protein UVH3-like isoform X2 [Panicum virgatum]|uniref:DNA repair protein UVH3-like isoform X2 n=1 Tax=Panicum virgatum TaxID=38727 RepID=UPI0019D5615F|nr:DNA repair protein UVH3-like isoform X2 [Panicum virgatum]